jgi:uncharacterized glyoxalase superfamily protein PhnB
VKANRSVPSVSVIPELPYPDVREAAEWLCRAFGFRERLQIGDHRAQLVYEDGAVIVIQGEAGAKILSEPTDWPYGERQYSAEDLGGHRWTFSESIADVDPADWGGTLKE